jgi:hypothetical protein
VRSAKGYAVRLASRRRIVFSIGDAQAVLRERGSATEESRREQLVLKRGRVVNNKPALMGGLSSVSKGRRIANEILEQAFQCYTAPKNQATQVNGNYEST